MRIVAERTPVQPGGAAVERILRALRARPGSSRQEIARYAFVAETTLSGGGYLRELKRAGLIHISGWRRNGTGAFTIAQYSVGKSEDCRRPRVTRENRAAPGMQRLLEAIRDFGPIDYRQAARLANLSPNTVKNAGYLDALVAQRKIHIAEWRRSQRGPMRPVYEYGRGGEAQRPAVRSRTERAQTHRRRKLAASANLGDLARSAGRRDA